MRSVLLTALMVLALAASSSAQSIPGDLTGAITAGGQTLHIVLHVQGSAGNLTATMDSPDQHACGIHVDSISLTGSTLKFAIASINASYTGTQSADGIDGTFTQNGATLPLKLSAGTLPCSKPSS